MVFYIIIGYNRNQEVHWAYNIALPHRDKLPIAYGINGFKRCKWAILYFSHISHVL